MRYIIHLIFYDRAGVQLGDDCVAKLNFKYLREHKGTLPAWGVVESQLATLNLPDNQMIFPTCIRFPTSEPEVRLTWALVSVTFKCHWTNSPTRAASVDRCQMCISSMKWSIRSCFFFCNVVTFWWVMLFLWLCLFCLFVISISLHHLLQMLGRWVISKHEAALCYTFKSQSLQSHKKRPRLSSISLLQNNSRFPAFVTDNARLLFVFVVVLFGVVCVIWLGWRRASLESDSSSPWNGGRLDLLPSSLSPASQVTVYLS